MIPPNPAFLDAVTAAFAAIPEVKALVLSGSTLTRYGDERSDFDFYVYADEAIGLDRRTAIAERFAAAYRVDNHFYETDDEWLLPESGKQVEFIYRHRDWIQESLRRVWVEGGASLGYTTCLVFNVANSRILHDPEGWFAQLQASLRGPYPDRLARNIVAKNIPMLYGRLNGSFREQIRNAIARDDSVALNHRISVFLASYFDVLFALNRVLCPGEKHLLRYAHDTCRFLPEALTDAVTGLIAAPPGNKPAHLDHLTGELRRLAALHEAAANVPIMSGGEFSGGTMDMSDNKAADNRATEGAPGQTTIKTVYGEDPRDAREVASEANEALVRDGQPATGIAPAEQQG